MHAACEKTWFEERKDAPVFFNQNIRFLPRQKELGEIELRVEIDKQNTRFGVFLQKSEDLRRNGCLSDTALEIHDRYDGAACLICGSHIFHEFLEGVSF